MEKLFEASLGRLELLFGPESQVFERFEARNGR